MLIDENFNNKFDNLSSEDIDAYVNAYKNLDIDQMLLLDDITRKISDNKNNFEMILKNIMKASIEIEYYEGCDEIVKIEKNYINNLKKIKPNILWRQ